MSKKIKPTANRVYYAHFRFVPNLRDDWSNWSERSKGGHATLAMMFERSTVRWSVSWCSPKDKFVKREGRLRAAERLFDADKSKSFQDCPMTESYYQLAKLLIELEIAGKKVPSWARKAKAE